VSVIQQALAHQPTSRCALLQALQAAAHPFAFCLPPSASVSLFGVTASFQLGPAPIIAPCDALRGQGQRCVRPTHATQHFQYEHPHFVGSRFVTPLTRRRPSTTQGRLWRTQHRPMDPRKLAFHDARIASAEDMIFLAAFWLRGILSLASTMCSYL
jgi:hypothetical protein